MVMLLRTVIFSALCCTSTLAFISPNKRVRLTRWNGAQSSSCTALRSEQATRVAEPLASSSFEKENQYAAPGMKENAKFECDESVEFWRDFQRNGFESTEENIRSIAQVASRFASMGQYGIDYWLRHAARSGYFSLNAALGVVGSQLEDKLKNPSELTSWKGPTGYLDSQVVSRLLLEAALCYEQDYARIQKGLYPKPWDMYYNLRQSSPLNVATQTTRFVREALDTLKRRGRGSDEDKSVVIENDSSMYPDYYKTAFHYQTNGWMSKQSADAYETSTETLFVGRQDSMQRTALPELVQLSKNKKKLKVLEIACGTGRFMTFVRDSLPLDTEYTAVDLSPYYLDVARDNDAYWRSCRKRVERQKGRGYVNIAPASIVQGQAENLPFDPEEFDAVVCVYLFHELPREVRAQVAAEAARVVRPGGMVVFTDSVQKGDRPIYDEYLANFGNMNEPYYADYVQDEVFAHFERAGLVCGTKTVSSSTKSLTFTKPRDD